MRLPRCVSLAPVTVRSAELPLAAALAFRPVDWVSRILATSRVKDGGPGFRLGPFSCYGHSVHFPLPVPRWLGARRPR